MLGNRHLCIAFVLVYRKCRELAIRGIVSAGSMIGRHHPLIRGGSAALS
jgi:hypothetical protein